MPIELTNKEVEQLNIPRRILTPKEYNADRSAIFALMGTVAAEDCSRIESALNAFDRLGQDHHALEDRIKKLERDLMRMLEGGK